VTHAVKVDVVLDAGETVAVGDLVLVEQDLVGALERWRNDESAALVVEGGKQNGRGGDLDRGCELRARRGAARDGYDVRGARFGKRLGFVVLLGGDEGVDAIGGGAIEGGVIAEPRRGDDDARFALLGDFVQARVSGAC